MKATRSAADAPEYGTIGGVNSRLFIAPDFQTRLPSRGSAVLAFDEAWDRWRGERVDENRMRDVEFVDFGEQQGYLKRFHGIQKKNAWRLRLQQPRAQSQAGRESAIIHALHEAGFESPKVLAWGQEIAGGREQRSLLLTAPHEGTALNELRTPTLRDALPEVADELGRTVRAGIFLPDLGLDHVFALDDGGFGLIDFHNARKTARPRRRELGRALVRFFRSPGSDSVQDLRLEFAERYLSAAERMDAWKRTERLFDRRLEASEPA